jgi:hypothetical protein
MINVYYKCNCLSFLNIIQIVVYKLVEPLHVIKIYTKLEEQVEVYEVFPSMEGWGGGVSWELK